LASMSGAVDALPVIGGYVTAILGNLSDIVSAAAVAVILMVIKDRVME